MIKSFPLDYMHLVCLGVMRKLIFVWLYGSLKTRLRHAAITQLSNMLTFISYYTPNEFGWEPRSLDVVRKWKAAETRKFLLYTGTEILKKTLPKYLFEHFLLLHAAIKY